MKWPLKRLDDLGTLSRGRSRHRPRNDESLYDGIYPFVQTGDVKAANFYLNKYSQTYNDKGLQQSKLWPADTLCITIAANIAETAILKIEACFPDSIIGFTANPQVSDVRFVKYSFDIFKKQFQQISQGATQDNLSMEKLLSMKVPCPSLKTQQKIASILSAYDDLIENNLKRIKLLEEAAQNIYKEWFVNFRINGEQLEVNKETGLPAGWNLKPLCEICYSIEDGDWIESKDQGGETPDYRIVQVSNIGRNAFIETGNFRHITESTRERLRCREIQAGDILISRMPNDIGRSWLVTNPSFKMVTVVDVAIVKVNPAIASVYYMNERFNSDSHIHECELKATGTTRKRISKRVLSEIKHVLPAHEALKAFDKIIGPMYSLKNVLYTQIEKLKESRDLLLPRLMNGSIEV